MGNYTETIDVTATDSVDYQNLKNQCASLNGRSNVTVTYDDVNLKIHIVMTGVTQ